MASYPPLKKGDARGILYHFYINPSQSPFFKGRRFMSPPVLVLKTGWHREFSFHAQPASMKKNSL
jgi:hypothetical protein